jgi:hypothetical protein
MMRRCARLALLAIESGDSFVGGSLKLWTVHCPDAPIDASQAEADGAGQGREAPTEEGSLEAHPPLPENHTSECRTVLRFVISLT